MHQRNQINTKTRDDSTRCRFQRFQRIIKFLDAGRIRIGFAGEFFALIDDLAQSLSAHRQQRRGFLPRLAQRLGHHGGAFLRILDGDEQVGELLERFERVFGGDANGFVRIGILADVLGQEVDRARGGVQIGANLAGGEFQTGQLADGDIGRCRQIVEVRFGLDGTLDHLDKHRRADGGHQAGQHVLDRVLDLVDRTHDALGVFLRQIISLVQTGFELGNVR